MTNGERAAAFAIAAFLSDDSLDQKLYIGTAQAYVDGTYDGCPECGGRTVEFRGRGLSMQHRICSRYADPGHKTWEHVQEEIARVRIAVRPSSRGRTT